MRKQAINSSSLRIAVRKNYSLLLVKTSLFAFASVAIAAKHLAVVDVGSATFAPWRDVVGFHFTDFEMLTANRTDALLAFVNFAFHIVRKSAVSNITALSL